MPSEILVTMPLSGRAFVWRSDGVWREVGLASIADSHDDFDDWIRWTPTGEAGVGGAGQVLPGDSSEPSWWLRWGEAPQTSTVLGWLADNTDVTIVRLGGLWIAEWISRPQMLFVEIDDEVLELPAHRPAFAGSAVHRYSRSAPNPRPTK